MVKHHLFPVTESFSKENMIEHITYVVASSVKTIVIYSLGVVQEWKILASVNKLSIVLSAQVPWKPFSVLQNRVTPSCWDCEVEELIEFRGGLSSVILSHNFVIFLLCNRIKEIISEIADHYFWYLANNCSNHCLVQVTVVGERKSFRCICNPKTIYPHGIDHIRNAHWSNHYAGDGKPCLPLLSFLFFLLLTHLFINKSTVAE